MSTEINSSWLVYESITALDIRTPIAFNLFFPNKFILSCFLLFYFAQVFIPTAKHLIPTGTKTNEADAEIETASSC